MPPLDEEGRLVLDLIEVIETREKKLQNRSIKEYLVYWKDLSYVDATWEGESILQHQTLIFLEGK